MLKFSLQNSLQSFESFFWYGLKGCWYVVICGKYESESLPQSS